MIKVAYPIYKGLQQPLVYRGFKGRFIGWGIASLVIGLITGGLTGVLTSMYLGGFLTVLITAAGLTLTMHQQRRGLHAKTRNKGIVIQPVNLKIRYDYDQENRI